MTNLEELWSHQSAIRRAVNKVLGPHRRHHREDLEMHCYAELTKRIDQYRGEGKVLAWAMQVLKGVTADWLDELKKREAVVAESHGGDPDAQIAPEKVWTGDKFADEVPTILSPERPKGAAPDDDDDLTEWAQGDTTFMQADEVKHDEMTVEERAALEPQKEPVYEDDGTPVEVPPTMVRLFCKECADVRNVLQQFEREQHLPPSRDGSKDGNYAIENKVSTFVLECGHTREETKTLNRLWIRPSRATGNPRGRPTKINEAATL